MAKRSDNFAQKLLDDLRIRKEKLGFSSTSGQRKRQATSAAEAYGSSHRSYHAGQTTKNKINEKNMLSMDAIQMLGRRQSKITHPAGSSQDIVPFERSTNLPNSVDVSMALALALSNSGKLQNVQLFSNIAVGNERIMHRGSLYLGERNSQLRMKPQQMNQSSFLASLQAGDISMGIQQLNNMLQAYSGGAKFTRESIEIGRELLRGAMDLEESLKMLIIVQDASDYMVGSQAKQIRLLKGAEEDDRVNHKKTTRRSSFYDGHNRHSQKLLAKEDAKHINQGQRILAPSQSRGSITTRSPKESSLQTSKQSNTHRRSMSYSSLSTPEPQENGDARKHAQSSELVMFSDSNRKLATSENVTSKNPSLQGEKVRMPSVIAKLMGLEELPVIKPEISREKEEIDPKSRKEIDKSLKADAEKVKSLQRNVRRDAEKKVLHEKNIDEIEFMTGIEVNYSRGKTHLIQSHDTENLIRKDNLQKIHVKMDNKIEDANKNDGVGGSMRMKRVTQLKDKINEQGPTRQMKEERISQDSNILVSANEQRRAIKRLQCQDGRFHNKDMPKDQKKCQEWSTLASNQINLFKASPCNSSVHKVNPNCAIQGVANETELHAKIKLKLNRSRSSEQKVKNEEKSACKVVVNKSISGKRNRLKETGENTKNRQVKNPRSDCTYLQSDRKDGCRSFADKPLVTKIHTENQTLPHVPLTPIVKQVDSSSSEKMGIVNMAADRGESYTKSDMSKDTESQNIVGQDSNNQASSDELEHIWVERNSQSREITSHNIALAQRIGVAVPSNISPTNARWKIEAREKRFEAEANLTNTTTRRKTDEKAQGLRNSTSEVESFIPEAKHPEDQILDKKFEKCSTNSEVPEQKKQGLPVKNLSMFTRQLSHSQQFINTANAIFEFEIPTDLAQTIESEFPKEESELLLDCGLELIRRKGKREEVTYNMMRPHAHLKGRSFSELIKELNDDIESLNLPSKPGADCLDAAAFLYIMLERDIHNRNPDCNCMWDFGWNSSTLAIMEKNEIAGDASKQILDGLICEMARDLMPMGSTPFEREGEDKSHCNRS